MKTCAWCCFSLVHGFIFNIYCTSLCSLKNMTYRLRMIDEDYTVCKFSSWHIVTSSLNPETTVTSLWGYFKPSSFCSVHACLHGLLTSTIIAMQYVETQRYLRNIPAMADFGYWLSCHWTATPNDCQFYWWRLQNVIEEGIQRTASLALGTCSEHLNLFTTT